MTAEVRELIASLRDENNELRLANERLACERNTQSHKIELQREQINDLLRRLYGRKSERFENPDQIDLLDLLGEPPSNGEESHTEEKLGDLERVE